MIILTGRHFHDDWVRVLQALWESNEAIDYFHPFHVDKAILTIKDTEQAHLLCLNRGWVTIVAFTVKFENWSRLLHGKPKLYQVIEDG